MTKGMGRRAAALAISGIATATFTVAVGTSAAHAFDDKKPVCGNDKDQKDDWDIFGDKDKDGDKDGDKDAPEKKAEADELNKGDEGKGLDEDKVKDGDKDGDKDEDWFNWDDKDKDKDCPAGVGVGVVGVGVGVGGVAGGGGVPAGGGGMADRGASSPLLPVAGATIGALLIGAGVARRRTQGAS